MAYTQDPKDDVGEERVLITININRSSFKPILCSRYRCRSIIGWWDGATLLVQESDQGSMGIPIGRPRRWLDEGIFIEGLEEPYLDKLKTMRRNLGSHYAVSGWVLNGRGVKLSCPACTKLRNFAGAKYLIEDYALFAVISP